MDEEFHQAIVYTQAHTRTHIIIREFYNLTTIT